MPAHDDEAAVGPPAGEDDPDDGVPAGAAPRDARIEELRAELERLQARVAADMARQRRAAMKLQALLEEERHLARRARREQRAGRLRERPEPPPEEPLPEEPTPEDSAPAEGPPADGREPPAAEPPATLG